MYFVDIFVDKLTHLHSSGIKAHIKYLNSNNNKLTNQLTNYEHIVSESFI